LVERRSVLWGSYPLAENGADGIAEKLWLDFVQVPGLAERDVDWFWLMLSTAGLRLIAAGAEPLILPASE